MSYAKLHTSLLTSSLWTEDTETRIVWITLLCLADKHGEVQASIPGLAKVAGVSLEACEKAIAKFLSPDKYSRSRVMEGRRLQEIDGGWEIITYAKHRAMASKEDEKEKAAERQQRFRERNALVTPSNGESQQVTPSNAPSRPVTENRDIADADADADANKDKNTSTPQTPPAKPKRTLDDSPEFLTFWQAYPRKVGKPNAARAFAKALRLSTMEAIMGGLTAHLPAWAEIDPQFTPHPATWLNRQGWNDAPTLPVRQKQPPQSYGHAPVKRTETETDRLMRDLIADGIMRRTADGKIEAVPIEELSKTKP